MITDARSARAASLSRRQFQDDAKVKFILDAVANHIAVNTSMAVDVPIKLSEAQEIFRILKAKGFIHHAVGLGSDLSEYRHSDETYIFTISWNEG